MASSEKLIPNFLSRATLEYLEKCFDQVKEEDCQDTRMYCNKHGRFSRFVDDKDSLILKKNRSLDEANINVIHDIIDVYNLGEVSAFPLFNFQRGHSCKGGSYVK